MTPHNPPASLGDRKPSRCSAICIVVLALLVLYPLSAGPAMFLVDRLENALAQEIPGTNFYTTSHWPRKIVNTLYTPLCRLSDSETLDGVLCESFGVLGAEKCYQRMKRDRIRTLLGQARIAIKEADFDTARETALYVQELDVAYGPFEDCPKFVLDEIERLKSSESAAKPSRTTRAGLGN